MILGFIFGSVFSILIGGSILMLGNQEDRGKTKVAIGLGIFWTVASITATATSTAEVLDNIFWLVMATFGVAITAILVYRLWVTREIRWWGD